MKKACNKSFFFCALNSCAAYKKPPDTNLFMFCICLLDFFFLTPCHFRSVNTCWVLWSNFWGDQRKGWLRLPGFKSSDVQTSNRTLMFIRAAAVTQTTRQPRRDGVYLMSSWFIFATAWTRFPWQAFGHSFSSGDNIRWEPVSRLLWRQSRSEHLKVSGLQWQRLRHVLWFFLDSCKIDSLLDVLCVRCYVLTSQSRHVQNCTFWPTLSEMWSMRKKKVEVDLWTGETDSILLLKIIGQGRFHHLGPLSTQASNKMLVCLSFHSKGRAGSGSPTWFWPVTLHRCNSRRLNGYSDWWVGHQACRGLQMFEPDL